MKKKWIAVLVMLMLAMADGIYVDGGQDIKIHESLED